MLNQLTHQPGVRRHPARRPIRLVIGAIAGQVVNTPLSNQTTRDVFKQKGNNYALFTHNIFKITDQLSLTLGARYTVDRKKLERQSVQHQPVRRLSSAISSGCRQLAAAAAANPAGNGGLNPAIAGACQRRSPTRS